MERDKTKLGIHVEEFFVGRIGEANSPQWREVVVLQLTKSVSEWREVNKNIFMRIFRQSPILGCSTRFFFSYPSLLLRRMNFPRSTCTDIYIFPWQVDVLHVKKNCSWPGRCVDNPESCVTRVIYLPWPWGLPNRVFQMT